MLYVKEVMESWLEGYLLIIIEWMFIGREEGIGIEVGGYRMWLKKIE